MEKLADKETCSKFGLSRKFQLFIAFWMVLAFLIGTASPVVAKVLFAIVSDRSSTALAALSPDLIDHLTTAKKIEKGRELSDMPAGLKNLQGKGEGYESLGNVFRDPDTGKLYLIEKSKP